MTKSDNTDHIWQRAEIESPCIKVCVIEPKSRVCTGCLRTIDEIGAWSGMTPDIRSAVMDELESRRATLTKRRGGRAGRLADS